MIDPLMQQQTETVRAALRRERSHRCECGHSPSEHRFAFSGGTGWCSLKGCYCTRYAEVERRPTLAETAFDEIVLELHNLAAMREWAKRKQGEPESV